MTGKFICAGCKKEFPRNDAVEAEMLAEVIADFGPVDPAELVRVCDECYNKCKEFRASENN